MRMEPFRPSTLEQIPQPPALPVIGNLRELDRRAPVQSFMRLAREFGPIFRLALPGREIVVISNRELVNEACDERRFDKLVGTALTKVRAFTGDGLFTSWTSEPNWHKAHSILLPSFGPAAMQAYLPEMIDIADQLIGKWSRLNPDEAIDVADDMTRLTLDTIGLCGFDYRFHSFYRDQPHPFIQAMVRALAESQLQANRMQLHEAILFRTHRRLENDIAHMNAVVDRLITERRADRAALATKRDLLNHMLTGVDKHTGERLDDVNIRYQIVTFLIAGHETTSGLLSFALYFLLKNPAVLARAYQEVDQVLGVDPRAAPTNEQVQRLGYVEQILKESLRLWPTAPAFALYPREATTLLGRYALDKGQNILVILPILHRDPAVWGKNVESFDPERFAPDRERQIPANAFKPFGNGQRACIGQQFAMQEAKLVLGMILRRFELIDHTNYTLQVKETLTIKPDRFLMKVRVRAHASQVTAPTPPALIGHAQEPAEGAPGPMVGNGSPLLVLFGSNLGTAEGIAHRIAGDGRAHGFSVAVAPLDDYVGRLPAEGALVIVCSSYNGAPPDNAARFCEWLSSGDHPAETLRGVNFAVFGCGDHHWSSTYQAVPTLIDDRLAAGGATRICERGEADAAGDHDGQFRAWYGPFWAAIGRALGLKIEAAAIRPRFGLRIETLSADIAPPFLNAHGAQPLSVVDNHELQKCDGPNPSDRSTRHIELSLAEGVTYQTGDHLGVVPRNRPAVVDRVLARFGVEGKSRIIIRLDHAGTTHLPVGEPIQVAHLLAGYLELQETATRDQVAALAERVLCPPDRPRLAALSGSGQGGDELYQTQVLAQHRSVLDLLEQFESIELTFAEYVAMLPPLRPRYYSISSSPLKSARVASITVGVVKGPARAGNGIYEGVASNFLAELPQGGLVHGFIRGPGTAFRPPADARTPMIMVGAGTGLAPFRGFLQERAALKEKGLDVGPSLLFFGCRHPGHDFLYEDELREYEARGLTRLITAFSRAQGQPKCYVQHRITAHGDAIWELLDRGAVIYVCGDAASLAPDVQAAFRECHRARSGADSTAALSWLAGLRSSNRYVEDVWASA